MKIISEERMVINPAVMESGRVSRGLPPSAPRSKGVHVGAVNRSLGIAAGKLSDPEDVDFPFDRFTGTSYPLLPALGVGWEEFRVSLYPLDRLIWQPGELSRDGLFGTPDALIWEEQTKDFTRFGELKYSTKKCQSIKDLWMYLKQGLCYCAMTLRGLSYEITRVQYDICFALGDYSRPFKPIGQISAVEFSRLEIESWWSNVRKAAPYVKPE